MPRRSDAKAGFTLIELSIVLVVIGLIVGGVLVGRDLIRAAELRKIITNVNSYNSAVMTFKSKYNSLPGDIPNATAFWPAKTGCINDYPTPQDYSTERVCNGDDNGIIGVDPHTSSQTQEIWAFWQHMALAGLIPGDYTGQNAGGERRGAYSVNSPSGPFNGIYGFFNPGGYIDGDWTNNYYSGVYKNGYIFTQDGFHLQGDNITHILTPTEMYSVDSKVDDGKPGTGNIKSYKNADGSGLGVNCVTTSNPQTSEYQGTNSEKGCSIIFTNQF